MSQPPATFFQPETGLFQGLGAPCQRLASTFLSIGVFKIFGL